MQHPLPLGTKVAILPIGVIEMQTSLFFPFLTLTRPTNPVCLNRMVLRRTKLGIIVQGIGPSPLVRDG